MDLSVFVPMLAGQLAVADRELLEHDFHLHLLLGEILERGTIGEESIFKGGSCLIKCFLDYPRFSADLDFTWATQDAWSGAGTKAGRLVLRPIQRAIVGEVGQVADKRGFTFDPKNGVRYGRSNRMMSVSIGYRTVGGSPGNIRMQWNFEEPLLFPPAPREAKSLLAGRVPRALEAADAEATALYRTPVKVRAYDPREILAEKARAILTRQAAKGRDVLDLFLIERRLRLRVQDFEDEILEKTRYSADGARRYREHLAASPSRLEWLLREDVRPLLIKPIEMGGFTAYRAEALAFLGGLANRLAGLRHPPRGRASASSARRPRTSR